MSKPVPGGGPGSHFPGDVAERDRCHWPRAESAEYLVPDDLQAHDIWLVWAPELGKVPMAPWETGNMFPAAWGGDVPAAERPEAEFRKAEIIASLAPDRVHDMYTFPPEERGVSSSPPNIPERLLPTIMLPHDPPDPPIMQVDFDDVRDPETGRVPPEVADIIKQLDAYTEISQSGEGLHAFVRAHLPGDRGKFLADLDTVGGIELYDHGRFVGATWDHVRGTSTDVPVRQGIINQLVHRYDEATCAQCETTVRTRTVPDATDPVCPECGEAFHGGRDARSRRSHPGGSGGESGVRRAISEEIAGDIELPDDGNAYYQLRIDQVADTGYFSSYRDRSPGPADQGPHPSHGPLKSDLKDCTNFSVEAGDDVWFCFAHNVGGGPLALLAVTEGVVGCGEANSVHRRPKALLKTCLLARERLGGLDDATPPAMALVGIAEMHDLAMADPENDRLGDDCRRIATLIYDEMDADDVSV